MNKIFRCSKKNKCELSPSYIPIGIGYPLLPKGDYYSDTKTDSGSKSPWANDYLEIKVCGEIGAGGDFNIRLVNSNYV